MGFNKLAPKYIYNQSVGVHVLKEKLTQLSQNFNLNGTCHQSFRIQKILRQISLSRGLEATMVLEEATDNQ